MSFYRLDRLFMTRSFPFLIAPRLFPRTGFFSLSNFFFRKILPDQREKGNSMVYGAIAKMDLDVAESFEEIGETTTSLTIGFFIIRWPKREQKEKRVSNLERGTIHKGLNAYIGGRDFWICKRIHIDILCLPSFIRK